MSDKKGKAQKEKKRTILFRGPMILGAGPPALRGNTCAGMIGTESTSVGCTMNLKLNEHKHNGEQKMARTSSSG
jgi:hypothetical protein